MIDLVAIQAEQVAWSRKNFGEQHARYPLLGMIEEILEFDEAWDARLSLQLDFTDRTTAVDDVIDAIGDIAIYMLDYCGKVGWQMDHLWHSRPLSLNEHWARLVPLARLLAHHQLKGEQGIRGTPESHQLVIRETCQTLLSHLERISSHLNRDFLEILNDVWSKVRLRDWTKNKANAHEVAAQEVIGMTNAAGSADP